MADYYTKVCVLVPFKGRAATFFMALLKGLDSPPLKRKPRTLVEVGVAELREFIEEGSTGLVFKKQPDGVRVQDDGEGQPNLQILNDAIRHTMLRFGVGTPVAYSVSFDCNAARTDAYGGAAFVITPKGTQWFDTSTFIASALARLKRQA